MHPEFAIYPEFAGVEALWRSRRSLHAFLLASLLVHLAIIVGIPDLLPRFATPGASVLEVTLLGPKPAPAPVPVVQAEPVPEPALTRPEPARVPSPQAKPEPVQQHAETAAKPAAGKPAPAPAASTDDVEIVGSFRVAPSRGLAPVTAMPDPAAEAAALTVTPAGFDAAYLKNPAPRYPPAARRAGEQGTVMLRVLVLRDGLPNKEDIDKSSGSRLLDEAARDAVWGWRFTPARHGTDPVESWLQVPVRFRLEDAS